MEPAAAHGARSPTSQTSLSDVLRAHLTLRGKVLRTPVLTSPALDELFGCQLFFKTECLQHTGSFKFRGAYNLISQLSDAQLAAGLVTASSGNHAQAVALAARLCGASATILMPRDAPLSKRSATERLGARVVEFDRYADDPDDVLAEYAARSGRTVVHPYDDARIVAGAGTVGRELIDDLGWMDLVLAPVGGGGLLAGIGVALSDQRPMPDLVGVEPASSDDWARSVPAGQRVRVEVRDGIADGQQLAVPGALTFATARQYLDRIVVVSDDQIRSAMRLLLDELHLVVEPSGASAFAAVHSRQVETRNRRVAVVLSGGNIDLDRLVTTVGQA